MLIRIYVDYIISERISQDTFGIFYRNRAGDVRAAQEKAKKASKSLFFRRSPCINSIKTTTHLCWKRQLICILFCDTLYITMEMWFFIAADTAVLSEIFICRYERNFS